MERSIGLMQPEPERRVSVCELAAQLGRSESYVWAMRRRGFEMIGGRARLSDALEFLRRCPHPRAGEHATTD